LRERRDAQLAGSSLTIVSGDAIVGAIVLNDTSSCGREIASVAKTLAELMIRHMTMRDPVVQQR
jgi:hypothetical protein